MVNTQGNGGRCATYLHRYATFYTCILCIIILMMSGALSTRISEHVQYIVDEEDVMYVHILCIDSCGVMYIVS